jgi:hypothetical protein
LLHILHLVHWQLFAYEFPSFLALSIVDLSAPLGPSDVDRHDLDWIESSVAHRNATRATNDVFYRLVSLLPKVRLEFGLDHHRKEQRLLAQSNCSLAHRELGRVAV